MIDHCPSKHGSAPLNTTGSAREYWKSLEDYADTPAFREWAEREFPALASELSRHDVESGMARRRFLRLMGASMALATGFAGLTGCRRDEHRIQAYKTKPEEIIPGKALYYATTMVLGGKPMGILAETHQGRPTKLEGNPNHPASLGALTAFAQASVLDLYDPDRSRMPLNEGRPSSFDQFLTALDNIRSELDTNQGEGLAVVTGAQASPALDRLFAMLVERFPKASIHEYEPLALRPAGDAGIPAFTFDLAQADRILAIDADILGLDDHGITNQRAWANKRTVNKPGDTMNRLYVVEPHATGTGTAADHHLRLASSHIPAYVADLARAVLGADALEGLSVPTSRSYDSKWIDAVAADLREYAGRSAIIAGPRQSALVHELVRRMNEALGNLGVAVKPTAARPAYVSDLHALAARLSANQVSTLLVLSSNLAYDAPGSMNMPQLLRRARTVVHLGTHVDETGALAQWHIPAAHYLESWGDALLGNVLSPVQPMIEPLFSGRTPLELIARLIGLSATDPYQLTRDSFRALTGDTDFEQRWTAYLNQGVTTIAVPEPAMPAARPLAGLASAPLAAPALGLQNLEVVFAASASALDGRFANNGWLQETPDPVSKLTWDNAAIISPKTAKEAELRNGHVVVISAPGVPELEVPVYIVPGSADYSVSLALGYGRKQGGSLARHAGVDASPLRKADSPWLLGGVTLKRAGRSYPLAGAQEHWTIDQHELVDGTLQDRAIIREATLEQFTERPDFVRDLGMYVPAGDNQMFTAPAMTGDHQWGMVIDLNKCVSCNACVVACQSENNIPIVGKDEVMLGREMHWLRIDRYFRGPDPLGDIGFSTQPMMCVHCENAPCEQVCPVNATVHDDEGLNVMVYNRCIGTRYCSNNCPYKVRRFNFFDYNTNEARTSTVPFDGKTQPNPIDGFSLVRIAQDPMPELLKMQKNPNVTVRMRGVMEKCTYCTQRLQEAKADQKIRAGQTRADKVPDGGVKTACQQSCPTEAIVFGDISDPQSRVAQLRASDRNYSVLDHLNTRPRTTYLARVRNINPAMPSVPYGNTPLPPKRKRKADGHGHGAAASGNGHGNGASHG